MSTTPNYPELLQTVASNMGVANVYEELNTQYPQFKRWTGSHNPKLHHYGEGGLVRHTWEIVRIGLGVIDTLELRGKIDMVEFYLAALFHDTGKLFDYEEDKLLHTWKNAEHKRLIYHLPRSVLIWHDISAKFPIIGEKYHDKVVHDILAHHGQREYGSPVAPKTHCAWLLFLCDSISARMDDCDRLDAALVDHSKV